MKFQPDKFDKIIFDMDGVITSEYIYWLAAALTVYELLYDYRLYGRSETDRQWCCDNYERLYGTIFCNGKTIKAVKNLGVNTNWDLAYIVFCVSKYIDPELTDLDEWHFESVRMFIENIAAKAPELYDLVGQLAATATGSGFEEYKRTTGALWHKLVERFQLWFLGDGELEGLNRMETPLLPIDDIRKTLKGLQDVGVKLGIGTGRPKDEIMYPLESWDLMQYFDPDMIVTYDHVREAEDALKPEQTISKPHPFVFLKAAFGADCSDGELLSQDFSKAAKRVAVVGDAPSDLMAAKAAKMKFVGVLTGVDSVAAELYFQANKADYILNDITELISKQ